MQSYEIIWNKQTKSLPLHKTKQNCMVKVSIIIPVYNTGAYLEETLKCLIGQTLSDIEILVVDDGSTDNSADIVKRMQASDSRISYFYQTNQGQSAARNHALKYASGQYIYFMDSDDIIDTDALRQCYEYAEHTQADFIFFDGDTLYEDGTASRAWNYKRSHLFEENHAYDGPSILDHLLQLEKHNCVVWLLFIRHNYLRNIHLDFYEGIIHEDELFTTKLTMQSNRIYCLQKSFIGHRVRNTSTMGIQYSKRNVDCYLTVIDELLKFSTAPVIQHFARYTLSKVFYTAHLIDRKDKPAVFWRALKSGYLKYIGLKSILVFWLKPTYTQPTT